MAMQIGPGGRGGKRGRSALAAEINVTPFVDVMLVLLIVFMITAPLLQKGVDLNLPDPNAKKLEVTQETPLTISIQADGKVFIQETETARAELTQKLIAIAGEGYEERKIHVRADKALPTGSLTEVLALVQTGGFNKVALVTDPRVKPTDVR